MHKVKLNGKIDLGMYIDETISKNLLSQKTIFDTSSWFTGY